MNSSWLIRVALAAQAASLSEAWVGVAVRTWLGVRVSGSRDVAPFFPLPVRIDRGRSGQRESGMRYRSATGRCHARRVAVRGLP
jgi:hypothetical protein